jgi:hypothetical protein
VQSQKSDGVGSNHFINLREAWLTKMLYQEFFCDGFLADEGTSSAAPDFALVAA